MNRKLLLALAASLLISGPLTVRAEDEPKKDETKKVEPVDYHKIKDILKETWADLKRTSSNGSKTKFGDTAMSMAEADYQADKDNSDSLGAKLHIMDYASTDMAKAASAWASLDIDQESDDGYQKTTKVGGFPAMESFKTNDKSGSVTIIVAERFNVILEVRNSTKEQFKKLIEAVPVKEIAALKN